MDEHLRSVKLRQTGSYPRAVGQENRRTSVQPLTNFERGQHYMLDPFPEFQKVLRSHRA